MRTRFLLLAATASLFVFPGTASSSTIRDEFAPLISLDGSNSNRQIHMFLLLGTSADEAITVAWDTTVSPATYTFTDPAGITSSNGSFFPGDACQPLSATQVVCQDIRTNLPEGSTVGRVTAQINLNDGNDTLTVTGTGTFNEKVGGRIEASGGLGNDTITGGPGDDMIDGDGFDQTDPGGNDLLNGGPGNDTMTDGRGNDVLNGEAGNDTMNSFEGKDTLHGGAGNDDLGPLSVDNLTPKMADVFYGDAGNDTIGLFRGKAYGGAGNDRIWSDEDSRPANPGVSDCGAGVDTVVVGTKDSLRRNCEYIERRDLWCFAKPCRGSEELARSSNGKVLMSKALSVPMPKGGGAATIKWKLGGAKLATALMAAPSVKVLWRAYVSGIYQHGTPEFTILR